MKPVLELLGKDFNARSEILASDSKPVGLVEYQLTEAQLELLARRAREEMREACALEAGKSPGNGEAMERILALPLAAQPDDGSAVHPAHGQRPWCAAPGEACCGASPPGGLLWGLCVKPAGHPRDEHREMHADINGRTWWRDAAQPDGTEKGNAK